MSGGGSAPQQSATHAALLRQIYLQDTRRRINRVALWRVIDLAFGVGVLAVSGACLGDHWPKPALVTAALGLMVAAVLFLVDNVRQLVAVSKVGWTGPIADIQLIVSRLRQARVRQVKWIILLSPLLGLCLVAVVGSLIFGANVLESLDPGWVSSSIAFGLLFIPGGILIARACQRRWQGSATWRNLLDGVSGRSLVAAQQELERWADLGDEMTAAFVRQKGTPDDSGERNPRVTPTQAAAPTVAPRMRPAAPYLESLAAQLPQLEILEHLGQGGMGVVYKARQRHLNRVVAVKILPPSLGEASAFTERFTREAQALAQLNHPNIVQVYDFGQTDEFFYFVMEYVEGSNLRALIRDGKLKPEETLKIVPQICEALQFAHDQGIVHRDIKPENILIDKKGRVKIADFGLAKLLGRAPDELSLTGSGQLMGTLGYMAPEQLRQSNAVDHRADIYSLGVVFYEMLTGQLPIGRFDPPSKMAQVDVRLDEVVLRALASEPDRRYQRANDVKTDVEAIAAA